MTARGKSRISASHYVLKRVVTGPRPISVTERHTVPCDRISGKPLGSDRYGRIDRATVEVLYCFVTSRPMMRAKNQRRLFSGTVSLFLASSPSSYETHIPTLDVH